MRKVRMPVLIIAIIVVLLAFLPRSEDDKNSYEQLLNRCGANSFLPSVSDVINDENINYKYYEKGCFFQGRGIVVSEKMTSEEFDKKKNMLFENSIFLTSPVYGELVERCTIPQVEFKIKGYSFRVLSGGKEANDYPHSFGMIAISEDESKILYFAYYNQDLDYIENMYDFVEDVFPGWENIGD